MITATVRTGSPGMVQAMADLWAAGWTMAGWSWQFMAESHPLLLAYRFNRAMMKE